MVFKFKGEENCFPGLQGGRMQYSKFKTLFAITEDFFSTKKLWLMFVRGTYSLKIVFEFKRAIHPFNKP
jgi:hypothetical protein